MSLGTAAWHRDDVKAFEQFFGEALGLVEALIKDSPRYVPFKSDLAEVCAAHGEGLVHLGRYDEAQASFQRAWENLKIAMSHDPDDPSPLPLLALLHERLGADAQRRGQKEQARQHFQEALNLRQEFVRLEPENRVYQAAYLLGLARCGKFAEAARGADTLRSGAADSAPLLLQLARCYAVCASEEPQKQTYFSKARKVAQALAALDYRDPVLLRTDSDLALLRSEPAFVSLLEKRE
jgi:tetratricopeptide (TPR) repeat protein